MNGRGLLRFVALAALATSVAAQDRPPLGASLQALREANQIPALAALVSQQGQVVDAAAVGVRKQGDPTPVALTDAFHLGSDTKAMTATLVAMLVDEGRLSWTSTLQELLPEITTMDPAFAKVTIEMLLAHRSGLGSEGAFDQGGLFRRLWAPGLDPVEGRRMVAREMLSAEPDVPPGSAFRYSNANYIIAGSIVEKLTGKPWDAVMVERLFTPLAMSSCGFGALGEERGGAPDQPWGHRRTDAALVPVVLDNPPTLGPAGTVHCSMQDWMKFIQLHMDAFNGRPRLVSSEGFAKLQTSYPGQDYTCGGWIRVDRPWAGGVVFTHDGSNTLNYATVWWAPKIGTAVMAVSNAGPPSGQKAAQAAVGAALKAAGVI